MTLEPKTRNESHEIERSAEVVVWLVLNVLKLMWQFWANGFDDWYVACAYLLILIFIKYRNASLSTLIIITEKDFCVYMCHALKSALHLPSIV